MGVPIARLQRHVLQPAPDAIFPTPLYSDLLCPSFGVLWAARKTETCGTVFALYLVLNGLVIRERSNNNRMGFFRDAAYTG